MSRKRIVLLGATGSIGENTLRVIRGNPDRLELIGIAACTRSRELAAIAAEFQVPWVALGNSDAANQAEQDGLFPADTKLLGGADGLTELATLADADIIVSAIVGTDGLLPTLAAIRLGKTIALASKEILVLAGSFVMAAARESGAMILPLDSEHNAIFQCIQGDPAHHVDRLILTASGGQFRNYSREQMRGVRKQDALCHPNWDMGPKITVDSSTMANKGLELIEARWLFNVEPSRIDVVVHPQSIVHSMVQFVDGSILAQLSPPSMTFAIQHTLLYPQRFSGVHQTLNFADALSLDFTPPDYTRFPCLRLAREAAETGGCAPAAFNAANEVAVEAFLNDQLTYIEIPTIIEQTLTQLHHPQPETLQDVLLADQQAREQATHIIRSTASTLCSS